MSTPTDRLNQIKSNLQTKVNQATDNFNDLEQLEYKLTMELDKLKREEVTLRCRINDERDRVALAQNEDQPGPSSSAFS